MKKTLSLFLAILMVLALLPAGALAAERTVSPWAAEEIARAESYGLLDVGDLRADYAQWSEAETDWTQPVTRAMFLRFALSYAAVMNHSDRICFQTAVNALISQRTEDGYFLVYPFTDDRSEESAAACALGITEGRGGGVFDPNARITRQEAATMLCRAYMACGGEADPALEAEPFTDEDAIAPWASEAVHILRSRDVLRGMGDGTFDPTGDFTIQQCAVCFLRLSEQMPVSFLKGNVKPVFTLEELISTLDTDLCHILRWDGPEAVFLRRDLSGVMHGFTAYYLAYPDGGLRRLEAAVPVRSNAPKFDSAGFSEDGLTFTYTLTLEEDSYDYFVSEGAEEPTVNLLSAAGFYTVAVDVRSGAQSVDFVPAEPKEGRWDDVPEDAWYYEAAEYSEEWIGPMLEKRHFAPETMITRGQMAEVFAHAYAWLSEELPYLPLRPADWGVAVLRLADGREFEAFQAWADTPWRTWTGPMNKEPWHYSIRAAEDDLTALFPELTEESPVWTDAVLDMGDKQVSGRLEATLNGDFEEGGPALLFYPAETSGYKDGGLLEPAAPTELFLCAQPGNEGLHRGVYFFAEKGIYYARELNECVQGWELAYFLYRIWLCGALPEEVFRPIYDVTLPEGTAYGQYLEPLYRAGILRIDDPDWTFDPAAYVTRAQLAVVLWRFMNPVVR